MNESKSKKINTILNIIIVLSIFFIFCIIYSSVIPNDLSEYKKEIKNLNTQISTLTEQIKNNENQITTLSENNKKLESENQKLKAEKNDLNNQIEELSKASSVSSIAQPTTSDNNSSAQSSTSAPESVSTTTSSDDNSQMVWVGETGSKYHIQSCSTLKGKGHQITLQQALAEGKQACKRCKP